MLKEINARLKDLLDGDNNPPELTALFHLRGALIWWKQGLLEPGDWSLRSYLPALVWPDVVAALRESGFWQEGMGTIPLEVSGRSRRAAAPRQRAAKRPTPRA
jgi:hypothetical protein